MKPGMVAISVFSALGRLRQEDCEFEARLGCTARPYLQNKTKQNAKNYHERQTNVAFTSESSFWSLCLGSFL
jgi:hypothetical protein